MSGVIAYAEKIHELVEKAPAGGIFHDVKIGEVAGVQIPGFGGAAGFSFTTETGERFRVAVTPDPKEDLPV